jgi:lipopolysaccharide/colanic/teichoic acid biosynthesis glycosyltransferase
MLLAIAIAVKLDSRGPVFYSLGAHRQEGPGIPLHQVPHHGSRRGEAPRDVMHMNERDGVLFKISNDPRITKLGRFCASIRWMSYRSSSMFCAAT